MTRDTSIGCMIPMSKSTCKRPAEFVYHGTNGPFYRCKKHGAELLRQRQEKKMPNPLVTDIAAFF